MRRRTLKASFRLNMSTQNALNLLASHYARVVMERHLEPRFDEYIQKNLFELARALTAEVPKSGVMFCGNCGNGKTTMLQALRNLFLALGDKYFSFVHEDFNANMMIYDARDIVLVGKDFSEIRKIRERDLVAIDDFGKEPVEVMDYGTLSDNKGRKAVFRNVVLIMTSNAGAQFAHQASVGFASSVTAVGAVPGAMANQRPRLFAC